MRQLRALAAAALLAVLLTATTRSAHAAGSLSPTFVGVAGSVVMSSGSVTTLITSGMQTAGFVMANGLNILEGGFLRLFAIGTTGVPMNPAYSITYVLAACEFTVSLPANACPSNAAVTLQAPSTMPPNSGSVQALAGCAVQVLSCPNPTTPVSISFSSFDVTNLNLQQLQIAAYNSVGGAWIPLKSQLDSTNGILTASINALTTFAVVQAAPSPTVGSVYAFPNPFQAARGDLGVTFINLPAGASLHIYTLRGEKVKDLTANSSGQAFWDVTNRSGAGVATGVYFVLLQGGGPSQTIKIGVQR